MKKYYLLGCIAIICVLTGCSKANAKYYYESAVYEYDAQNYDEASKYIAFALSQNAYKSEYHTCDGMIDIKLEKYEDAIEAFGSAITNGTKEIDNENNKSAYRGRGIAYLYSGKYEEAVKDFDKALEYDCLKEMNNDINKFKVEALIRSEDYANASKACDEVMNSGDYDSDMLIQKGMCETKLGNYDKAKELFDQAIKEKNNLAYYYMSLLYKEQGMLDEAVKTIKEYMDNDKSADVGMVYCEIASSYIEAGEYQKAIDIVKEGLSSADGESKKLLMRDEIAAIEATLDFATAHSKVQEYLKVYPDDEAVKKEKDFLETRINQPEQ